MAGKEPEKPKPKLYNPLLDQKIEDTIKNFQSLYAEDSQENFKKERGYVRRTIRHRIQMHLAQHGIDEKTKMLKRHGYHDMKADEKRKWVEDFLHTIALDGVGMHLGKGAQESYASNMGELRDYIEKHMVTDKLKSYDAIVEKLSNSKNLIDDFDEDEDLAAMLQNYTQSINSFARKNRDHSMHLQRIDYASDVLKYANGVLKKQGLQLQPYAPVSQALEIIVGGANPDARFKKGKYVTELPKDGLKKAA
jgi:hypothetical protein